MARKFTKVNYLSDETLVKQIIAVYKSHIRFIHVAYIRNDRVIDLETNTVYIDSAPGANYNNTINFWRHGGDISMDDVAKATLQEDGLLVGNKVVLDMKDDVFNISIQPHIFANFQRGSFHWPIEPDTNQIIESLSKVNGCEEIANKIKYTAEFYPEFGISGICSAYHKIEKYNLYSILGMYSKLIAYSSAIYEKENTTDFFESIKIPKELIFRLSNYYLNSSDNSYAFFHVFQYDGYIWKFCEEIPEQCKKVFLEEAMQERFDIANVVNCLNWQSKSLIAVINESPEFFNDYIKNAKLDKEDDVLTSFINDANDLKKYDIALSFDNLPKLKLLKKAQQMKMSTADFFNLIGRINTKQGIIEYILADKS